MFLLALLIDSCYKVSHALQIMNLSKGNGSPSEDWSIYRVYYRYEISNGLSGLFGIESYVRSCASFVRGVCLLSWMCRLLEAS